MQKANDDVPILQIYKLKYRKKLSLYYTHDIFSSLDETFCGFHSKLSFVGHDFCQKEIFHFVWNYYLVIDKFLEIKMGERHPYAFFLRLARHMIYVKERIGAHPMSDRARI